MLVTRSQHDRLAINIADLDVLQPFADPSPGLKHGHRIARGVPLRVLEKVNAVVGLVGAIHDEIEIPITVKIHRQGPRPQPDAQIHHQTRMVVLQPL